jgi:nucleoside-diphosphate-sugar epimerase
MAKRKLNGHDSARPYRVRDPETMKFLVGRNYVHPDNALDGAWKAIHWAAVGDTLEVININDGERCLAQYKSLVNGARILKGK